MSTGVEDVEGCLDFCAEDFEFFGVLDALDKALMCFCYNSEAEYQQYGESDICVDDFEFFGVLDALDEHTEKL